MRKAPSGRNEYLLIGSLAEVARAVRLLEAGTSTVLRERRLANVGLSMAVVDLGPALSAAAFRRRLADEAVRVALDSNALFGFAADPRLYAADLVSGSGTQGCRLARPVRIGVVDGPVDARAPALSAVRIESHSVLEPDEPPAPADHGTGIVSLIAANASAGVTPGLAQGAHVLSAVAFSDRKSGSFASSDRLADALDWLAGREVQVVNMSLAGPPNKALGVVLAALASQDVALVAATGNDGLSTVAYPASDPHVIGISAIDAARRLFVDANRGDEVDFVAPGVEVLVAQEGRAAYRSGTSFAAAIATAVIAHSLARGAVPPDMLTERLLARSEDLGRPGHDTEYGWGLLRLPDCPGE